MWGDESQCERVQLSYVQYCTSSSVFGSWSLKTLLNHSLLQVARPRQQKYHGPLSQWFLWFIVREGQERRHFSSMHKAKSLNKEIKNTGITMRLFYFPTVNISWSSGLSVFKSHWPYSFSSLFNDTSCGISSCIESEKRSGKYCESASIWLWWLCLDLSGHYSSPLDV